VGESAYLGIWPGKAPNPAASPVLAQRPAGARGEPHGPRARSDGAVA